MIRNHRGIRAGVDIGGTFTDVALDVGGVIHSSKVLTDYEEPARAVLSGLKQAIQAAGATLGDLSIVIHGTTLATNALISRTGARTAFITTEGFRDVVEMRTENRFEQYDLDITLPKPLVERCDRYTLCERVGAHGEVLIAPDPADIERLVDDVEKGAYESIAIGFINAFVNGAHERMMRDAIVRRMPDVSLSISSEVSPQLREFERFNTVCANAYVRPQMQSYLGRLVHSLQDAGATCPVFVMHSGGGIISVESAARFPVRLVESGPAGGAIFAAHIAQTHDLDAVLSFDVGGTTAKICLVDEKVPKTANTFEVARTYRFKKGSGMPISIPVVEMVEIGAGGGSIATVDAMKQIRVGPRSAGSEPGPACYQRGCTEPTVTDADLVLGRLDPENFAGGAIRLSTALAEQAIERSLEPLHMKAREGAYGISEVVDENMSNAARAHAVESGKEITAYTMVAFGGAGPLHAARLCEKTGIERFLVPPGAGVGSAIGFLKAPFGYESVHSSSFRLANFDEDAARTLLAELGAEAMQFASQGDTGREPELSARVFMRYVGQGWEIPVDLPDATTLPGVDVLGQLFSQTYERYFGRTIAGLDIEVVSWAVKASSPQPPAERAATVGATSAALPVGERELFDARTQQRVRAKIYERDALRPGMTLAGPAIVVERETATWITGRFQVEVQSDGCLLATVRR